jgi:hypothetical protein
MKSFDCKQCKVSAQRSIFLTGLFKKLSRGGKERQAEATVLSRRMASARFPTPGSTWEHCVKFSLADGGEVEILAPEDQFQNLTEGMVGILTWEGENLLSFEIP